VQNTTYYLLKEKDLPLDKILNLKRKIYLKAKVQLAYDTFAKYPMSMSSIMSSNKKRRHGKPDCAGIVTATPCATGRLKLPRLSEHQSFQVF
jgi:hypothetical protein